MPSQYEGLSHGRKSSNVANKERKGKGIDNHESFMLSRFKFKFNDLCGTLGVGMARKRQSSTSRHYYP